MKKILIPLMAAILVLGATACSKPAASKATETTEATASASASVSAAETQGATAQALPAMQAQEEPTNYVRMDIENGGSIVIELAPDAAPITVENFKKLVKEKFYDGVPFHRAVPNFVIQGGDPDGTGMGGSKEKIKGEFLANGVFNPLKHKRGVLSMARTAQDMNSASSQFFIVLDSRAASSLNDNYAAFGSVIAGMDEVDRIAALPTDTRETIQEKPVMRAVYFVSEADAAAVRTGD